MTGPMASRRNVPHPDEESPVPERQTIPEERRRICKVRRRPRS
jgi:hypothetical protein